jgi:hypothetical protein
MLQALIQLNLKIDILLNPDGPSDYITIPYYQTLLITNETGQIEKEIESKFLSTMAVWK